MKKAVLGWALFDFADTAFSALFITFFFPVLIKDYLGGNAFHIGLVTSTAMFLSGILVPYLGAWSDEWGRRKPFLLFFIISCAIFAALTSISSLTLSLIFALLAMLCYHASLDMYDSLLALISTHKNSGKISSIGVAFGYAGTITSLALAYGILSWLGWNTKIGIQTIIIMSAFFYLIFSIFLFAWTPDGLAKKRFWQSGAQAFTAIKNTFSSFKVNKTTWKFLLASMLYTDGMHTAIVFLYLFGSDQLGIGVKEFFPVFAIMAVASGIGAVLFGKMCDNIGPKKTLLGLISVWTGVILLLLLKTNHTTFMIAGILGGAALGGVWTVTRPMLLRLVPKKTIAQFMGFQGLTEKFSGILGPALFGLIAITAGYKFALLPVLLFFILGFAVLWKVDEAKHY